MRTIFVKIMLFAAMLVLCLTGSLAVGEGILKGYEQNNRKYEYVLLGNYPYEKDGTARPVLWRVMETEGNTALLMTEYIIDTSQVIFETNETVIQNRTFRRITTYEESDMYQWMNTDAADVLMGDDPLRLAMSNRAQDGGVLFLLGTEDMTNTSLGFPMGFYGEDFRYIARCAVGTPYAAKTRKLYVDSSGYSTYWTCDLHSGTEGYKLWIVSYNGHISAGVYTRVNIGIRPATLLDMSEVTVTGGSGTKEDPYLLAYADEADNAVQTQAAEANSMEEADTLAVNAAGDNAVSGTISADAEDQPEELDTDSTTMDAAGDENTRSSAEALDEGDEAVNDTLAADNEENTATGDAVDEEKIVKEETASVREGTAVLSFVGDCSIGDTAQYITSTNSYHTTVDEKGYAWPFSTVYEYLNADDLTCANLEAVLTTKVNHEDKRYYLKALPDHVNILLEGSVEVVNTVNNHCMDFFESGYNDCMNYLDEAGVDHFGTLKGTSDISLVKEANGIRFGFTGFSYPAIENNMAVIKRKITDLKEIEGCDFVIVSLHWGRETHTTPSYWQPDYAKQLIDAGADVIWGHHPHVLQPVEFYKGKPIFYSLGNFTFGTISDLDPATGIFQLTFKKTASGEKVIEKLQVIACQTTKNGDYRPKVLTEEDEIRAVYKKLQMKSNSKGCTGLPESFFETGIVYLAQPGE